MPEQRHAATVQPIYESIRAWRAGRQPTRQWTADFSAEARLLGEILNPSWPELTWTELNGGARWPDPAARPSSHVMRLYTAGACAIADLSAQLTCF